MLPSGVRDLSPVAVSQGTRVHPADGTLLLGQRTRGQVRGGQRDLGVSSCVRDTG